MDDIFVLEQEENMDKALQALKKNLSGLRAGRANPTLLDRITVDYYGAPTPLNQLGNISAPEPRLLVISPWDQKIINDIIKAIQKSDLGINPTSDGKLIRLVIPELTEERRKDLVKVTRKSGEEAKVAVRNIRRDANENIKKQRKANEITEDDQKELEADIQKLTDKYIKNIDAVLAEKEKEILSI